jgi:hypothetical protein
MIVNTKTRAQCVKDLLLKETTVFSHHIGEIYWYYMKK